MTKARLLAVGSTAELCEVVELGKYWGFRCGHWMKVKVLSLPCARGGTGEIAYAPIDKRGYPYAGGIALRACQAFFGPVKAWGDKPPKVSRDALLRKGVSDFWLPKGWKTGVPVRVVEALSRPPSGGDGEGKGRTESEGT